MARPARTTPYRDQDRLDDPSFRCYTIRMSVYTRIAGLALLALPVAVRAEWTFVSLDPAGSTAARVSGSSGNIQVGGALFGNTSHAGLWQGTAGSFVNLHPATALKSWAQAAYGNQQVGYARMPGDPSDAAAMWFGTSASYVRLHPSWAWYSQAWATDGVTQVGYIYVDYINKAVMWQGTPESCVLLYDGLSVAAGAYGPHQVGWIMHNKAQACMWSGSAASRVPLHPVGAYESRANCITADRQGGFVTFVEGEGGRAGYWTGTAESFKSIHPEGYGGSGVSAMLDNVQVGNANDPNEARAAYWTGSAASHIDLHTLASPEYVETEALTVATDGEFIYVGGYGQYSGSTLKHAVLWKRPVAEAFDLVLNKSVVAGQNYVLGTINLEVAAQTPSTFSVYDNSSLVTTPSSVTVPAQSLAKNFQITVMAVNSTINTSVYAKRGQYTRSRPLTLAPLVPTALAFNPNPVSGGQSVSGRVVINGVAGPGGRTIALFDNSAYATTPSSVIVPPGASDANFMISTIPVTQQRTVTVTARVSAGEKTGTFRINP